MKTNIFLFLMFWFTTAFCPNANIDERKLNQSISSEVILSEEEISNDSTDVKILEKLKMIQYFSKKDRQKVRRITKDLGIKTKWLYKAIYLESRGKTSAKNPYTDASGLIGFMPSTAIKLNTTVDSLRTMNVYDQLDYVHKYFRLALPKNKKMYKASDVYLALFSPGDLHKADSTIIGKNWKRGDCSKIIYKQNKILDVNKDSIITIKDVNLFISLL